MSQVDARSEALPALQVFVYGTLMRGECNHRLCADASAVVPARVAGRLYAPEHNSFPYLQVPKAMVMLRGSLDLVADMTRAHHPTPPAGLDTTGAECGWVQGELMLFADGEERLALLDWLEGFDPENSDSHTLRVLVPVQAQNGRWSMAWTYINTQNPPPGLLLPSGRWLDHASKTNDTYQAVEQQ